MGRPKDFSVKWRYGHIEHRFDVSAVTASGAVECCRNMNGVDEILSVLVEKGPKGRKFMGEIVRWKAFAETKKGERLELGSGHVIEEGPYGEAMGEAKDWANDLEASPMKPSSKIVRVWLEEA